jgi:hypothetical protein
VERVAHEDPEVSKSAPSGDSLSTLYGGSDARYAGVEFDDAALVLSALFQPSIWRGLRCLLNLQLSSKGIAKLIA